MKTTVDIPDALLREAKEFAARHGVPLREVFERGLILAVRGGQTKTGKFKLKTIVTDGNGLRADGDWNTIRSFIYEGRGG